MWEIIAQVLVLACFIFIAVLFSQEKYDVTAWVILLGIISAIITGLIFSVPRTVFLQYIPINSLIYLVFMDIFIRLLINEHIFEYLALRILRFTHVKLRFFFYVICIASALISGIMEDISVALIVNPIVFRAAKILNIDAKPYIYGTSSSIIIGNLLSPVASPVNIFFASAFMNIDFDLNLVWFLTHFFPLFIIALFSILVFIDMKFLRNQPAPTERNILILLEIMNPNFLIRKKGRFFRYMGYLIALIAIVAINIQTYLLIALFVIIITLVEEKGFTQLLKNVNWSLPALYLGLFLLISCISINGTISFIESLFLSLFDVSFLLTLFIMFILSSLVSSFLSRSLSLLIFATILDALFLDKLINPSQQVILIMGLLLSLQLGGNLVPQSSTFILKTIENAQFYRLQDFKYKNVAQAMRFFTFFEASLAIGYLLIASIIIL